MSLKENIQRSKERIQELEVMIAAWESTLKEKEDE